MFLDSRRGHHQGHHGAQFQCWFLLPRSLPDIPQAWFPTFLSVLWIISSLTNTFLFYLHEPEFLSVACSQASSLRQETNWYFAPRWVAPDKLLFSVHKPNLSWDKAGTFSPLHGSEEPFVPHAKLRVKNKVKPFSSGWADCSFQRPVFLTEWRRAPGIC